MDYHSLRTRLEPLYGKTEARAIADCLLGEAFGLSKADILCGAVERLSLADNTRLCRMVSRLEAFEPVQYVVGSTYFCRRRFKTAKGALIPRPETEELCTWITSENTDIEAPKILDIGTGSGCIACTLALDMRQSEVSAWDISTDALAIAAENARLLSAHVSLTQQDMLCKSPDSALWNIIVSNPPYICDKERADMSRNVLDYEPHAALFVPDAAPLLFYRAIAIYAQAALKPHGRLYFEINPLYADDIRALLAETDFKNIEIRTDQYGRQRMARAEKGGKL